MKVTVEFDMNDPKDKVIAQALIGGPGTIDRISAATAASGVAKDAVAEAKPVGPTGKPVAQKKRKRRTKAEMAAEKAAESASKTNGAVEPADVIPSVEQLAEVFERARNANSERATEIMKAAVDGKNVRDLSDTERFDLSKSLESVSAESFF